MLECSLCFCRSAGFAEKLFAGLDVKDAQCYNALIRGRAKVSDGINSLIPGRSGSDFRNAIFQILSS